MAKKEVLPLGSGASVLLAEIAGVVAINEGDARSRICLKSGLTLDTTKAPASITNKLREYVGDKGGEEE